MQQGGLIFFFPRKGETYTVSDPRNEEIKQYYSLRIASISHTAAVKIPFTALFPNETRHISFAIKLLRIK